MVVLVVGARGKPRLARHSVVRVEPRRLQRVKHKVAAPPHPVVAAAAPSVARHSVNRAEGRLLGAVASARPPFYLRIGASGAAPLAPLTRKRTVISAAE